MANAYSKIAGILNDKGVTLVAVSKTFPAEKIQLVYDAGCRDFGENRVQEMLQKYESLPKDIRWHLIGHLQTNKVKFIAPFVHLIHAVDSLKLLMEIDKQATNNGRILDCLLQFHIAEEETKFGLDEAEAIDILDSADYKALQSVRICGVMGMATFTEDTTQIRREFQHLHQIFDQLRTRYFAQQPSFNTISMGMSGDWEIAVEAGGTMVRIGSLIFGDRSLNPPQ